MTDRANVFADQSRVDLFAGFPVRDYSPSLAWYERLLGRPPIFYPNEIEAVWELAEHRYIFIKALPESAGHAYNLFFLSNLETFIAQITARGLTAAADEILPNNLRKVIFRDPDGNEVGFAGTRVKS